LSDIVTYHNKEIALCKLLDNSHLTSTHWRIWFLSAMGIFLDGFDLFIISIALPLIIKDLTPNPLVVGAIGSAAVIGAILGASFGGVLTDRFGRKSIYIVDLLFFIIFSALSGFSWDVWSLIIFRFLLGVGVGADYPICASYVSEFMPACKRGKMLIGAFAFQAIGMFAAAIVGLIILYGSSSVSVGKK
jgi:MFS transporter, putative metabolite transport protein